MKKRILSMLLTVAMIFSMLPTITLPAFAADENSHTHDDSWVELTQEDVGSDGTLTLEAEKNYYLGGNINLSGISSGSSAITISGGTVNFCLNGYGLIASSSYSNRYNIFSVASDGVLNLYDCNGSNSTHYFDTSESAWAYSTAATNKAVTGGVITGVYKYGAYDTGGAVNVAGTFNLYGGSIVGNEGTGVQTGYSYSGAGVFNMYGGAIMGTEGSAVYVGGENGAFNMYSGVISDNKTGSYAAVEIGRENSFSMSGDAAVINNNSESGKAGGVNISVYSGFPVSISGDAVISDNTCANTSSNNGYANNLYYYPFSNSTFELSGNVTIGDIYYYNKSFDVPIKVVAPMGNDTPIQITVHKFEDGMTAFAVPSGELSTLADCTE